jgi:ferredoxin-NADP reductase
MLKTSFTLLDKIELTRDVYELTYACENLSTEPPKPGQYVMFQLAPGLNRAYSLAASSIKDNTFTLIIKRVAEGKWSPLICNAEIGSVFQGMIPLGHFVLRDTPQSKCFIGTGTGFAPLYYMIKNISENTFTSSMKFIFWVRSEEDIFYTDNLETLGKLLTDFSYTQYLSRPNSVSDNPIALKTRNLQQKTHIGYVTDWITRENIAPYEEFYICGSPAMVKDARAKLEELSVPKEQIFWEQF